MYEQQITYDDPHVIASSSTGESSNRTLQGDFIESTDYLNVPQVIPRPRKNNNIPTVYQRLSDRYTFTFSADLISQFDKYRAQMRESIRQELETDEEEMKEPEIIVSNIENEEETFSVHQVHHSNFGSNLYSQDSNRDITSESAPKSCLPKSNQRRKYQIFSFFLRGKSKPQQNITASDMDIRSISMADTQVESFEFQQSQQSQLSQQSQFSQLSQLSQQVENSEKPKKKSVARKILGKLNIFKLCTSSKNNEQ